MWWRRHFSIFSFSPKITSTYYFMFAWLTSGFSSIACFVYSVADVVTIYLKAIFICCSSNFLYFYVQSWRYMSMVSLGNHLSRCYYMSLIFFLYFLVAVFNMSLRGTNCATDNHSFLHIFVSSCMSWRYAHICW